MALYYELPIYKDSYALVLLLFQTTRAFHREYKYTIGQEMKQNGMKLVQYIFQANSARDKSVALAKLSDCFELLKLQLRLCVDMRLIAPKQHAEIWEKIDVIGKQLNGWKKHQEKHETGCKEEQCVK